MNFSLENVFAAYNEIPKGMRVFLQFSVISLILSQVALGLIRIGELLHDAACIYH